MPGTGFLPRLAGLARAAAPVLLAVAVAGAAARADDHDDHERARAALRAGEILPLGRLLDRVARDFPGDVLEVELERDDGRWIYELTLLRADGAVVELAIDAAAGDVLEIEGDRLERRGAGRAWDDD